MKDDAITQHVLILRNKMPQVTSPAPNESAVAEARSSGACIRLQNAGNL
jgi:hypothetical protein